MNKILSMSIADIKNILREPIPLMMTILPVIIGLIFRIAIPFATE